MGPHATRNPHTRLVPFLFSPYTLPYGYLGFPNPDRAPTLYQEFLDSYESWGRFADASHLVGGGLGA